jgi:3D (Asp-Asp-Asp) domain-containing protein
VAAQAGKIDGPVGEPALTTSQPVQALPVPTHPIDTKVETTVVPFGKRVEISRTVGKGRMVTKVPGVNGKIVKTFAIREADGKPIRELIKTEKIEPVEELVLVGSSGYSPSRGGFTRGKTMILEATAYDPSAGLGAKATFTCKNGMRARYGMVAVDPRVIKLGTILYVEGYGMALAADTGGAIKGNRIDLCMATNAECIRFGRRKVTVHILK